jgi:catechol 2,3-dioxygenase-like lactoylglutathione lyase family enzyme
MSPDDHTSHQPAEARCRINEALTLTGVALLVPTYEAGLDFYVRTLGFHLVEDTPLGAGKRWVAVKPSVDSQAALILMQPSNDTQRACIGRQAGGRVFLFLTSADFRRTFRRFERAGVHFTELPRTEAYGHVVVFQDPFGNRIDLLGPPTADQPPIG